MNWYVVEGINPEPWETSHVHVPKRGMAKSFKSGKLGAYQAALGDEFQRLWSPTPTDEPIELHLLFWRSTAMGQPADVTNLQKATEDALQGVLYENDRDVHLAMSAIVEQDPDVEPRIAVRIRPVKRWIPDLAQHAMEHQHEPTVAPATPQRDRSDFDVEGMF